MTINFSIEGEAVKCLEKIWWQGSLPSVLPAAVFERDHRSVEKLAVEAVCFAEFFVKRKIAMLFVHHNGITVSGEMQTDLMHPACGDVDANEGRF